MTANNVDLRDAMCMIKAEEMSFYLAAYTPVLIWQNSTHETLSEIGVSFIIRDGNASTSKRHPDWYLPLITVAKSAIYWLKNDNGNSGRYYMIHTSKADAALLVLMLSADR